MVKLEVALATRAAALLAAVAAAPALGASQLDECQVPDKFYSWELPAHCCEKLCDWLWNEDRWEQVQDWWFYSYDELPPVPENPPPVCSAATSSCYYNEQATACYCLGKSGDYAPGDPGYDACRAAGGDACAIPGAHCMQLEDGYSRCKSNAGVLEFALTTGLLDVDDAVPQDELQAVTMMALFAMEDFNTFNSSCGSTLELTSVYRDDLDKLSVGSFFNMASQYDLSFVTLRSTDMLYSLSGAANAYSVPVVAATASGDELWDNPIFDRVHQVSRPSSDLAAALCELLQRLGQRAAAVLLPEQPSEDDLAQLKALDICSANGIFFQHLPYPPANAGEAAMADLRDRLDNSRASVFVPLGPGGGAERFSHVLEQAAQAGRLAVDPVKPSQWIFLDRTALHVAERLPAALRAALDGSLVVDQREVDDARLAAIVARHWGQTDLTYYAPLVPEFTKSAEAIYAEIDPMRSQYVRTLGAHLYDAVQLLGHMTCDVFPDGKVPGYYKAARAFWVNETTSYDFVMQGLTGDIKLVPGANGRDRRGSAGIHVEQMLLNSTHPTGSLERLGEAADADLGGVPALPASADVCPPGDYRSSDERHACCELCPGTPNGCAAAQVCVVPDSFLRGSGCRCDVGSTLRVMALIEQDSPAGRAAASAAAAFNARTGDLFERLAACDKEIELEWTSASSSASMVPTVLSRLAESKRLDAVLGPTSFAQAEAVGIVLNAAVTFSPLHAGNRFRGADMAPTLLRVVPSVDQQLRALCAFHEKAGFRFVNVFALSSGEGLDLLEAHARVCREGNDTVNTLQHVLASEDPALAAAAVKAAKDRKLNTHVVAMGCDEPMLVPLLQSALDEGLLVPGSAWIFPFWDAEQCAEALSAELQAALSGSLAVARAATDAELAYDAVAALGRAACAATPDSQPLMKNALLAQIRNTARGPDGGFSGMSGWVELDPVTGDRVPSGTSHLMYNIILDKGKQDLVEVDSPQAATFTGGVTVLPSDTVPPEVAVVAPTTVFALNYVLAALCLATSAACFLWTWVNRRHPVVRVSQLPFLMLVIFGTVMQGVSVLFLNVDDKVVGPAFANVACRAHLWLMAIGFELTFAPLFLRLYRVSRIMRMSAQMRRKASIINNRQLLGAVVLTCLFDVIVLIAWEAGPARVHYGTIVTATDEFGKPLEAVGVCTTGTDSEPPYLYLIYGYHLLLLLAGSYVCWTNRGLSSAFSEHKPSANAIITTLQIQSIALPVFFMVREDPAPRIFVQGMMVALVVLPTLAWIFVSKWLYIKGYVNDTGMGNNIIKDLTTEHSSSKNEFLTATSMHGPEDTAMSTASGAPRPPPSRAFKKTVADMSTAKASSGSDSYV